MAGVIIPKTYILYVIAKNAGSNGGDQTLARPISATEVEFQVFDVSQDALEMAVKNYDHNNAFNEAMFVNIRQQRNQLLRDSDWTQINDVPVDKEAWANYRQKLRDIPQKFLHHQDVIWPEKPL